ncbi:succinate dehydrogenase hydrophobic anchor subunit [Kitasatospora gansuensis]|uniref:Succinate dehydrogenase hydrophobic anchor subunit n=1 Tax=Kitasatospora gansuensis TaxID=258050 RepID=A0A7W7WJP0_9ACTN|nr:hypothetical protein [Kitasatospora gansuensis]MBB4949155.1 succinate dehydrogenase hydrophobic anchor subunit [Kitasatospora gansuensis]
MAMDSEEEGFGPDRYAKPRKVGGPRGAWQLLEQVSGMTLVLLLSVSIGLVLVAVQTDNAIAMSVFSLVWLTTMFALMGWLGRRHEEQAAGRHRRPA